MPTSIARLLGVLNDHHDVGVFIFLVGFSFDAEKEARTHSSKRLTLLDAQKLFDLWIEHYGNIPPESEFLLPIRSIFPWLCNRNLIDVIPSRNSWCSERAPMTKYSIL